MYNRSWPKVGKADFDMCVNSWHLRFMRAHQITKLSSNRQILDRQIRYNSYREGVASGLAAGRGTTPSGRCSTWRGQRSWWPVCQEHLCPTVHTAVAPDRSEPRQLRGRAQTGGVHSRWASAQTQALRETQRKGVWGGVMFLFIYIPSSTFPELVWLPPECYGSHSRSCSSLGWARRGEVRGEGACGESGGLHSLSFYSNIAYIYTQYTPT